MWLATCASPRVESHLYFYYSFDYRCTLCLKSLSMCLNRTDRATFVEHTFNLQWCTCLYALRVPTCSCPFFSSPSRHRLLLEIRPLFLPRMLFYTMVNCSVLFSEPERPPPCLDHGMRTHLANSTCERPNRCFFCHRFSRLGTDRQRYQPL